MMTPDGKALWHASLQFGDSIVYLSDESVSQGTRSPQSLGGTPVTLQLNVENADALCSRAVEAGATVKVPVAEMFWGDRYGIIEDPFGQTWGIATRVKDLTPDEMKKGAEDAAKQYFKK
jgi:PhnB protein